MIGNYDEIDYAQEKAEFIRENQQKAWDLWSSRLKLKKQNTPNLWLRVAGIVEDWSGHELMIDTDKPPMPEQNIPF